jgi:hypothetical protein
VLRDVQRSLRAIVRGCLRAQATSERDGPERRMLRRVTTLAELHLSTDAKRLSGDSYDELRGLTSHEATFRQAEGTPGVADCSASRRGDQAHCYD